ncbi:hypothetical protein DSM106972_003740 [Dulcicalothrix desertica PCC 7102]|uniref:APAF-1 helical domain-containing protein n=1 Tax=Dulcicalothrix desertica PCC 7102 TaxID=232991 RepID=A0A433VUV6_9CYAN|nr:PQQ-binding-like beta-propeller repeat protein [Dulcicalothrix desertica]RUT09879.1 hypothetical protein DSM106972_003740 [Dulcicalothrix desertica PCC 7102]TWH51063.1 WD40 repeat protein [Dulcicalothrix desertica PCC 7102]
MKFLKKKYGELVDYLTGGVETKDIKKQLNSLNTEERNQACRHLTTYMSEARRYEQLYQWLTNFDFIEAKISALTPQALINDYDLLLRTEVEISEDKKYCLKLIQGALQLSASVLIQDATELVGQLTGRLLSFDTPEIQTFLQSCAATRSFYLRTLTASLTPPGGALVRTLNGHSGSVNAITVTADGKRLISGSSDNTLKVWNLETGEVIFNLLGHTAPVTAVAVTFDGRRVISGSYDKTLKVWDLETGEEKLTFDGHRSRISSIRISRKSQQVVSAEEDKIINVWNLENGEKQFNLNGHRSLVNTLAITSNDKLVISGSSDGIIKVWNLETGQVEFTFKRHNSEIRTLFISFDDKEVISASSNNNLRHWSLETGEQLFSSSKNNDWVSTVAITPNMSTVISGLLDNTLKIWDIETGKTIFSTSSHGGSINALVVTPDGKRFISASSDHTIKVWNLEIFKHPISKNAHNDSINAVAIIPNSKQVISASSDTTLKVWNVETGKEDFTFFEHAYAVNAVVVTPDGKQAISASSDNTIKRWNLVSKPFSNLTRHNIKVNAIAISGNGKSLISASKDNTLKLWNLTTGKGLFALSATLKPDKEINLQKKYLNFWYLKTGEKIVLKASDYSAFTSDDKFKINVGKYTIIIFDNFQKIEICNYPLSGKRTYFLSINGTLHINSLSINDESKKMEESDYNTRYKDIRFDNLIYLDENYKKIEYNFLLPYIERQNLSGYIINIYYVETNEKLTFKQWNTVLITSNDKWAIIAANNKLIVVEIVTGNETCIFPFNSNMNTLFLDDSGKLYLTKYEKNKDVNKTTELINAVALSNDGLWAASGSLHRALRIWDLLSHKNVLTFYCHRKSINAVAFSKDGLQIITASSDSTIKAWDIKNQAENFSLAGHKDSVNAFVISSCGK